MKIVDKMHEKNLNSLLVLNLYNITYLTGFKPSSVSALLMKDDPLLFVSKMDIENANSCSRFEVHEFKSLKEIKDLMKGRIGIESNMKLETFKKLNEDSPFHLKTTKLVEDMRQIKSNGELKNIVNALHIAEKSIGSVDFSGVENAAAAEIEYNMRLNGASKASFDTIVASGKRSSLPHAEPTLNSIEKPILIDWGAIYNNYCSDTSRTVIENEKHEEIFDIVQEAQKTAINTIKPGVKVSYIDKVAREVIEEHGYGNSFIHSTGHGVGLEVHEGPSLSKLDASKLQKGMVITVEPGIYIENEFGVRIEDMVYVSNRGKVLNKLKAKISI